MNAINIFSSRTQLVQVFGSAGLIGNPVGFARSLGLGIKDFFSLPIWSVFQVYHSKLIFQCFFPRKTEKENDDDYPQFTFSESSWITNRHGPRYYKSSWKYSLCTK